MSEHRRYLTIIQDPRGYPAKGGSEPAPPEGPAQPVLHRVVLEGDYYELRAERDELREALSELVTLKDGPRDVEYERRKPLAWQAARDALAHFNSGERV